MKTKADMNILFLIPIAVLAFWAAVVSLIL